MSPALVQGVERIVLLRGLPGLSQVHQTALEYFAASMRERVFKEGDPFVVPGEGSLSAWTLVSGRVGVSRGGKTVGTLGAGESIGWLELFAGGDQEWGASALETTLALEMERDILFDVFEDHLYGFELLHAALRELAAAWIRAAEAGQGIRTTVIPRALDGWDHAAPTADSVEWVERMLYLRGLPVFAAANVDGLGELAKGLTVRRVPQGAQLWRPGSFESPLHVISGTVQCRAAGEVVEIRAPALLGFPHALAGVPHSETAIAATDLIALSGDIELLLDVVEDNPMTGISIVSELARNLLAGQEPLAEPIVA